MQILIPPAFRFLALLLCIAAFIIPATGIGESFPALKANEHAIPKWTFCAGLLLFALAGKAENKERWLKIRKWALGNALGFPIVYFPVMALFARVRNEPFEWPSLVELVFTVLGYFVVVSTFEFYVAKKLRFSKES